MGKYIIYYNTFKVWNKYHSVFAGGGAIKAIPLCPAVLGSNQAFFIVGGMALKQDHLLQVVDTCFKLLYILNIEYHKHAVWRSLQHTTLYILFHQHSVT